MTEGLAPDLFTVVHDVFVTDTVRYADILLPPSSAVEHSTSPGRTDICNLNVNLPAIDPRSEAVSDTERFRRLAAGMGFSACGRVRKYPPRSSWRPPLS